MMNQNQRDTLATCLTQIFGRVEDRFIDAAIPLLTFLELSGGETLMKEGDPAEGVYFVISGRLRASVTRDEELVPIGEIGRGETVGEMGVLSREPRSATVVAMRDTVLAYATREAFDELWHRHPQLPIHMARIVIERLKRSAARPKVRRPATIAVVPITDGVDARAFADELVAQLDRWGVATLESREKIDSRFGTGAAETIQRDSETYRRVTTWLDDVEFWNEFVVLLTDGDSEWTRRCLRHADEVLFLANAGAAPALHPMERYCTGQSSITGGRQTVVLVHDRDVAHPRGTRRWLDRRPVDGHIHVRHEVARDMARLARLVSGNAIGLVLGGGGARGFAHLGVYRALEEAGIEIDQIGGTSIGAIMAALISFDLRADTATAFAARAFAGNPTGDISFLPLMSLIKGRRLQRTITEGVHAAVGHDADLVDTWRNFFCVAANYSGARETVMTRGNLARALRASVSIPIALPPVLWEGELFIDGGVFNNFPTDVMARIGARRIIGVDLAHTRKRKYEFEELPSTWEILRDRFRKRKDRRYRLPTLGTLLIGTTILYSESRREQARQSADLYFNPDLGGVPLLDWKSCHRIVEIGYRYGKEFLAGIPEEDLALYRNETVAQTVQSAAG